MDVEIVKKSPGRPKKIWTEEELAAKEAKKAAVAVEKAAERAAKKAAKSAEKSAEKGPAVKKAQPDTNSILAELIACQARITDLISKLS
jgi:membrane protein involved in colicin uptake